MIEMYYAFRDFIARSLDQRLKKKNAKKEKSLNHCSIIILISPYP
jgi:hypothetical protein